MPDLGSIGLYEKRDEEPVFKQLKRAGYLAGAPCPVEVLSRFDNMNYLGADASLEMLSAIVNRLGAQPTKLIDLGSGFGGTSRVMLKALQQQRADAGTTVTAIELQSHLHEAAIMLTGMAECSGDIMPGVVHVLGNAVTGELTPDHLVPSEGEACALISRLCILHIPLSIRAELFARCHKWLKAGGVLAFEDYAAAEAGLSTEGAELLEKEVAVPSGQVPNEEEWCATLKAAGFVDVEFEDCTKRWAAFVRERCGAADANAKVFDEDVGPQRRRFYHAVDKLFNPPSHAPTGLRGVRIYAKKLAT